MEKHVQRQKSIKTFPIITKTGNEIGYIAELTESEDENGKKTGMFHMSLHFHNNNDARSFLESTDNKVLKNCLKNLKLVLNL
jgi:hypothetical protein